MYLKRISLITHPFDDDQEITSPRTVRDLRAMASKRNTKLYPMLSSRDDNARFDTAPDDVSRRSSADSTPMHRNGKGQTFSSDKRIHTSPHRISTFLSTAGSIGLPSSPSVTQAESFIKKKPKDPVIVLKKKLESYSKAQVDQIECLTEKEMRALMNGTFTLDHRINKTASPKNAINLLGSNASKEARKRELIKKKIQLYELKMVNHISFVLRY